MILIKDLTKILARASSQKDSEFLEITWNSNPEHQWLSLEAYKSKNLQEIPRNVQEFLWMFKNYWEFK